MPLNTTPPSHKIHKKNFNAQEHGVDLNAVLEDWSGVPAAQAEAAGIAAHEAAERRAARKRQAAQTAAQAKQKHSEAVHLKWQRSAPMALRNSLALPLATWALLGLLVARSNANGVLKMSLREMQGRLSTTRPTVTGATKRLEALGWIDVDRRAIARDFNAINVYRLRHPLLRAAALACEKGGGGKGAFTAPKKDQKETDTNIQSAPLRAAGLHDEGGERARTACHRPTPAPRSGRRSGRMAGEPAKRSDGRAVQRSGDCREKPSGVPDGHGLPLAAKAEALLTGGTFARFNHAAYRAACHRHGPLRAALAVVAAAEMVRVRAGGADPVRDPPAYLAGMLRKASHELRPDVTLGRIEARDQQQKEGA